MTPVHLQRNAGAKWCGIVMVIRPDLTKLSEGERAICWVVSKRDVDNPGAARDVKCQVFYDVVKKFYTSDDGDAIELYAEVLPGTVDFHIEFVERASKRDFFLHRPQVTPRPVPAH